MRGSYIVISDSEFRRLWFEGLSRIDLARHFRCSVSKIDQHRAVLSLPKRKRLVPRPCSHTVPDPTPEEIEERARECRERHYAERRCEPVPTTKAWREQLTRSA